MSKNLSVLIMAFCAGMTAGAAFGIDLTGTTEVNVSADTSAAAKDKAFDIARRKIIVDALRPYADATSVSAAVAKSKSSDLMGLISSSGIDGEKISDTTYSANITMSVDSNAARRWMSDNNIQNWLSDGNGGSQMMVVANLTAGVSGLADFNRMMRGAHIEFTPRYMSGNQITVNTSTNNRRAIIAAAGDAGWRYSDTGGVISIWK